MEWAPKDATGMSLKMRTDGDGMETVLQDERTKDNLIFDRNRESSSKSNNQISKKHTDVSQNSQYYGEHFPIEKLINLTPKEIHYVNRRTNVLSREPKFVPYEPYKAATKPIIPTHKKKQDIKKRKSKNNLDLSVLISQMSLIDINPIFKSTKRPLDSSHSEKRILENVTDMEKKQWELEKTKMEDEMKSLRHTNDILMEQIKQQAHVNKELKTMLVASMGEDLKTTMQMLTEDKQQLASALLNSAQHLSTHQEQTEWLAGQCEVWRSKFLASSLMVEELAGLKTAFTQRTDELQLALRQMLEERNRVRDILIHTYRNLRSLHENWLTNMASQEMYYTSLNELGGFGVIEQTPIGRINLDPSKPKSSNILELSSVNLKFSENLCNAVEKLDDFTHILNELPTNTDAENISEKLLAKPLEVCGKNDQPSLALVHHAYTKTGMTPNIACCSHCHGQVQLL